MALAAGETAAPFPHLGGVAGRQIHDEIMGGGNRGGLDDLLAGGLRIGEGDVFFHRAIKEHGVLRHDADLAAQGIELHLGDVDAIHQHRAELGVVETGHQLGEGALAGTTGADDGDEFTPGDGEVDTLEQQG